jgi:hypothetical protein
MRYIIQAIFSTVFLLQFTVAFGQKDSSGIYFTAEDYLKHKLRCACNCKTEKSTIKADRLFHFKEISIRQNDSTYRLLKDSVYGVRYCDGDEVRIYNNLEYPIINPGETILIYKLVSGPKGPEKGSPERIYYYFSKDPQSKIQEFTIRNIKAAFSENHKFYEMVDMYFHSDADLISYDHLHKMMKINRVLRISEE